MFVARSFTSQTKPVIAAVATQSRSLATALPTPLANLGVNKFCDNTLKNSVSDATYQAWHSAISTGADVPKEAGKEVSAALFKWATARGAVNFSHQYYPIRGMANGQKDDAFVTLDFGSKKALKDVVVDDSIGSLFMSESDGSSHPNGGLRATQTAAAYMVLDRSSPPFVVDDTLYLPSAFVTHNGHAIDHKMPLLRSQEAVSKEATRLLHHLGYTDVSEVFANVGWEQEYFAVPSAMVQERPDILMTERTLLGANSIRGQKPDDHYFGKPNMRVKAFHSEMQEEFWKLGIASTVMHNEVAPAQHEFSPIFATTNVAADQNIAAVNMMKDVGLKHGLSILCHEKPFANINGSGKHCNWGLNADNGMNLFTTGKDEQAGRSFMAFTAAMMHSVGNFPELYRCAVSGAGNDHRLGAQEAPPAIFSIYTGPKLWEHCESVIAGGPLAGYKGGRYGDKLIDTGARATGVVGGSLEDRNRTAPLPFCGNRYEFRAVGSNDNISFAMAVMNTTVAEGCAAISDKIEAGASVRDAVAATIDANKNSVFNGNGYSSEWHKEAVEERGLPNLKTTVEALTALDSDKNRALFEKHKVLTGEELTALTEIRYDRYVVDISMEAETMTRMVNQSILPACAQDLARYGDSGLDGGRKAAYKALADAVASLESATAAWPGDDLVSEANYAADTVKPAMAAVRAAHDEAETLIASDLYPFPTYDEMLFQHFHESC